MPTRKPHPVAGMGWDGADYRPFSPPRRAVFYADDKSYDVLVTRYRRGRWQIALPEGAAAIITTGHGQRRYVLRPGKTTAVPEAMIEFVDALDQAPPPLPEAEAAP